MRIARISQKLAASQDFLMILLGLLLVGTLYFIDANSFIQDDAYIAFRYARHFAEGHGFVWYPGSDEFGYTSTLFTFLIGLFLKINVSAETGAFLISIPAMVGAIFLTFFLARRTTGSLLIATVSSVGLITNMTIAAYATGGLETSLQLFLLLLTAYHLVCWEQTRQSRYLWYMSLAAALTLLSRLDSALLLAPLYFFVLVTLFPRTRHRAAWLTFTRTMGFAVAIPVVAVAILLAFNWMNYGQLLPNTFYAKVGDSWLVDRGKGYISAYIQSQGYTPYYLIVLAIFLTSYNRLKLRYWRYRLIWMLCILLWCIYLLKLGGDFMEFRFMVPILPFFYLLIADIILTDMKHMRFRAALLVLVILLLGNASQRRYFTNWIDINAIESISILNLWVSGEPVNWIEAGKALGRMYYTGKPNDPKIAVMPAGAISYYSGLPTLDELGLNTREVLKTGEDMGERPGHRYRATLSYMTNENVNILIDHPAYFCKKQEIYSCVQFPFPVERRVYEELPIIFIPMENDCYLMAYYLNMHPAVNQSMKEGEVLPYWKIKSKTRCERWLPSPQ